MNAGNTNTQHSKIKKFKFSLRLPKKRVDMLTINGPKTHPNDFETFKNPKAIPLFLARLATKASLGEAKVPLAILSKILANKTAQGVGKNSNALEVNAKAVELTKIIRLFLVLSNKTPFAKRKTFDRNSVKPSKIPKIKRERPKESVTKKGIIVIPIVVEIANKKLIK